jgi:hypothetical protein
MAEEGSNDDLAMTCVHFGWLTAQKLFKETVSNDIRYVLQKELGYLQDVENVPFGFIDNGLDDYVEQDANGDLWRSDREAMYPFDNLNYDWNSKL